MENIYRLPTNKSSKIYLNQHNTLKLVNPNDTMWIGISQYIYITNDEPMTAGDWYYFIVGNSIGKFTKDDSPRLHLMDCKKIVMTNDLKLNKNGVQDIDNEFLEWFVKNSSCEKIEIEKDEFYSKKSFIGGKDAITYDYKIIIPKEEIYFDFTGEFDELPNLLDVIKEKFYIKEESKQNCKDCNKSLEVCTCIEDTVNFEEPKQETLEEAAKEFCNNSAATNYQEGINVGKYQGFIQGAKWQQERSYSEEEVYKLLLKALLWVDNEEIGYLVTDQGEIRYSNFNHWFGKFKKK